MISFCNDYSHIEAQFGNLPSKPSVTATIIIPFYSGLVFLDRTLSSLCLQTYPTDLWNVVVVEDGSPEPTESIVSKYNSMIRLSTLRQERNGFRLSSARNLGIRSSLADVIILLDFDIICTPNHLANHLRWFELSDQVATFGLRKFVDLDGYHPSMISSWINTLPSLKDVASSSNKYSSQDKRLHEVGFIKTHPFACNCFHGCNVAFWRQTALNIGLFDTCFDGYPGYEDIEFAYRLQKFGTFIAYEPETLVFHQENNVVTFERKEEGKLVNRRKLYKKAPGIEGFRLSIGQ